MEERKIPFEQGMRRLGEIVAKIEGETLPLEETLSLFQEGKSLIESLEEELKDAQKKVEEFLKETNNN